MDQTQLDNTYERRKPYSFIMGQTKTTEGFSEAVASMTEGETSLFLIPWQKLYGEQGIPGNLPQRADLTFTINLVKVQATNTQAENKDIVATIIEETNRESEDEFERPMHLVTYTKITIEIVTKYSEPRITEMFPASDKEEPKKEKETVGKEHGPERAKGTEPNRMEPATENSLQTNYNDNKDILEGVEVLEDKDQHQPSTSNIRKAF